MSEVQVFTPLFPGSHGYSLRVLLVEGDPWFVAADVCNILGVTNPSDAVKRLDEDEYQQVPLSLVSNDPSDSKRKVTLVSEPGLYGLVLGSRKAEARTFKRWVKHEVLPEIRKTGGYGQRALSRMELLELAMAAEKEAIAARAELEAARPAIEAHAAYMDAEGLCDMATAAAALKVGRNSLFVELRRAGVLISTPGAQYNTPKARYKRVPHGLGWFEIKTGTRERSSGDLEATYTTMVTSKGIEGIRKLLVL